MYNAWIDCIVLQSKKRQYDQEIENLEKQQKQTIERLEQEHTNRLRDEAKRIKGEQEKELSKFQNVLKNRKKEVSEPLLGTSTAAFKMQIADWGIRNNGGQNTAHLFVPLFCLPNNDRLAVSEVRYYLHFAAKKTGIKEVSVPVSLNFELSLQIQTKLYCILPSPLSNAIFRAFFRNTFSRELNLWYLLVAVRIIMYNLLDIWIFLH